MWNFISAALTVECDPEYDNLCDDFEVIDRTWQTVSLAIGVVLIVVLIVWFWRRVTKEGDTPKYF